MRLPKFRRAELPVYVTPEQRCANYRDAMGAAQCLRPGCARCWQSEMPSADRLQDLAVAQLLERAERSRWRKIGPLIDHAAREFVAGCVERATQPGPAPIDQEEPQCPCGGPIVAGECVRRVAGES